MTDRGFQSHGPSSFSHQQRGSSGREEEVEVRGKKVVGPSTGKNEEKKNSDQKVKRSPDMISDHIFIA